MASEKRSVLWRVAGIGLVLAGLAGCDAVPPEYEKDWLQLQREWRTMLRMLSGQPVGERKAAAPSPSPAVESEAELAFRSARNAKANAEILHELFVDVFMREPRDRSEFGTMVDTMNQGASIEGVYNGFVHSTEYRKLEIANPGASPDALQAFAQELAVLEANLPKPADFDSGTPQPLAPTHPEPSAAADGVQVIAYGKVPQPGTQPSAAAPIPSGDPQSAVGALMERYSHEFVGASIFTLKRVIGDEALRVIGTQKDYPEKLALWYSKWCVHMATRNVDFGIALRNSSDEQFHYRWALAAGQDRLTWEVLNRLQRVLNETNRQKQ